MMIEKVFVFVLTLAILAACLSFMGCLFSYVLGYFGIVVPWLVCAVSWFLVLSVIYALRGK